MKAKLAIRVAKTKEEEDSKPKAKAYQQNCKPKCAKQSIEAKIHIQHVRLKPAK